MGAVGKVAALPASFTAADVEGFVRVGDTAGLRAAMGTTLPEDAVGFLLSDLQAQSLRVRAFPDGQGVQAWMDAPLVKVCVQLQPNVPVEVFEDLLYGPGQALVKAVVAGFEDRVRHSKFFGSERDLELTGRFLRWARKGRVDGRALEQLALVRHLPESLMVELLDATDGGAQGQVSARQVHVALSGRRYGVPVPLVVLRRLWAGARVAERHELAPGLVRQRLADEELLLLVVGSVGGHDDWWLVGAVKNPSATSAVRVAAAAAATRSSTRTRMISACANFPDALLALAGASRSIAAQQAVSLVPPVVVLEQGSTTARVNLAVVAGFLLRTELVTVETVLRLAADPAVRVRVALAGSQFLPVGVLGVLAGDASVLVRNAVVKNRGTPLGVVVDLLADAAGSVREHATERFGRSLIT